MVAAGIVEFSSTSRTCHFIIIIVLSAARLLIVYVTNEMPEHFGQCKNDRFNTQFFIH